MGKCSVAVVILNYNGVEHLQRFLPGVVRHTDAEVIVADNGSTDDSVQLLRREFPSVRLVALERNYGFAEGYNRALEQVEAEYVVLLNSDVEVTEHWLRPLLLHLESHPGVAACQPKVRSWHRRDHFEYAGAAGGFIDRYGYPFCRGRLMGEVEKDCGQYDTVAPVFWATGAALFIRRADYLEAGGLDGRFFAHMEEIDLCWRLRSRGHNVVCLPSSSVYHVGGATLKKDNPHKTFLNFRNNLLMLYKNLPEKELRRVMCVRACLDYVAAAFFFLKADFHNAHAVIEARKEYLRLRPQFVDDRRKNLASTQLTDIPERFRFSILWQAKVRGRKVFTALFR